MGRPKTVFTKQTIQRLKNLPDDPSIRAVARTLGVRLFAVQKWIGSKNDPLPIKDGKSSIIDWLKRSGHLMDRKPHKGKGVSVARKYPFSATVIYCGPPDQVKDKRIRFVASQYRKNSVELGSGYAFDKKKRDIQFCFRTAELREKFCRHVRDWIADLEFERGNYVEAGSTTK
jgi:hypothetical protein